MSKLCPKCGRELDESEFHKNSKAKDGLQTYCKECQSKVDRERRERDKLLDAPQKTGSALEQFSSRELLAELKRRGFRGTLTYSHEVVI